MMESDSAIAVLAPDDKLSGGQLRGNFLAQQFLKRVYKHFKEAHPNESAAEQTAKLLGVSKQTVYNYKDTEASVARKAYKRKHAMTRDVRPELKHEIRQQIYAMHYEKVPVTVTAIHTRLSEKEMYLGCGRSLLRLIKELGFSYKQEDTRKCMMEMPDISRRRRVFLSKFLANEDGAIKKPVVFLDETWVFTNGTMRRSWQDDTIHSASKRGSSGRRYIILHAGTNEGFVNGAGLIFKSKNTTGDYHGDMNADNFEKWISKDLLPNLKKPSLIVLDNASYHSRLLEKWPTKSWKVAVLREWLRSKGYIIPEDAKITKTHLLELISDIPRPESVYVVDTLLKNAGHEVLRLPPYHCHYNAIEMVWSQVKRYYDQHIMRMKNVTETWEMALRNVSSDQWKNYVSHTIKVIRSEWEMEQLKSSSHHPGEIIINLDVSESSESE